MALFGYNQAIFSGVIINDNFLDLHDLVGPSPTVVLATLTAIHGYGCFFGAILAFTSGERMGRKKTVLIGELTSSAMIIQYYVMAGTTIMAIGTLRKVTSFSLTQMFVGRVILGIGYEINTATAPIWQSETAHTRWRGKLVIFEMRMNIASFSLCNWINNGLSFAGGPVAWRFPLAFQSLFFVVLFATVPWLPESPRWLIQHGKTAKATQVLAAIEGKQTDDPLVQAQQAEIQYSVDYEREHSVSWRAIVTNKQTPGSTKTLRSLLLCAGTQFMQQFEGINIMSYHLPTVLISYLGVSTEMAQLLKAINSVMYLIVSGLATPLLEKVGRRGLMLLSTAGQTVATAVIPFFFLYYISFGLGMLGVPCLYPTEINSLPMRTKDAAVATATNWITNFVIVEIAPSGTQSLSWRFWIVWTIFNAAFLPVIYFLYPETSNWSLEDLDAYYRENPSLVVIKDKDAISAKRPLRFVEHEREAE